MKIGERTAALAASKLVARLLADPTDPLVQVQFLETFAPSNYQGIPGLHLGVILQNPISSPATTTGKK